MEKDTKRRIPLWGKICIGIILIILLIGCGGYAAFNYYYNQMNIESDEMVVDRQEEVFDVDEKYELKSVRYKCERDIECRCLFI